MLLLLVGLENGINLKGDAKAFLLVTVGDEMVVGYLTVKRF